MKVYNALIMIMLVMISVFSIKNYISGQWDLQYAMVNGGMAIIVMGIYSGYMQMMSERVK